MSTPEIEMPPIEEAVPQPAAEQPSPAAEPPKIEEAQASSGIEQNMKNLREAREAAERENAELRARLKAVEEAQRSIQQQKQEEPKESPYDFSDDDYVEGKHLRKQAQRIKQLEETINNYQQKTEASTTEARLKAKYRDFDEVVNEKSIAALRSAHPELAESINGTPDLYLKASSAYTIIKSLGIYRSPSQQNGINKVNNNMSKPRPTSSVSPQEGDSPLSKANAFAEGLTEELRRQLWMETNKYRKT